MADELPDDPENIPDEEVLLRRIHPVYLVENKERTGRRLSTAAFKNTTGTNSMSVQIKRFLDQAIDALRGFDGQFLVSFTAGFVRGLNPRQGVTHCPTPDDDSHGDVWGAKPKGGVKEPLRQEASQNWIVRPSDLA